MAITCTPTITRVINEARREIVMSVEIDDGAGNVRTIIGTGKAKEQAEGKQLMDSILRRYAAQKSHEKVVATVKSEMETNAKDYLEAQLNG